MADQYEDRVWNLTGEEDLRSWGGTQDQTWYKTKRGWFLVTKHKPSTGGKRQWFSTERDGDDKYPRWETWDGTFPHDTIWPVEIQSDFSEDEIEQALELMEGIK